MRAPFPVYWKRLARGCVDPEIACLPCALAPLAAASAGGLLQLSLKKLERLRPVTSHGRVSIPGGEVPRRRRGLRRDPSGGWPLDGLLVGVGTLRTTRELFRWDGEPGPVRAWDLALWSGVSPQGAADSLERLNRLGLLKVFPSGHPMRATAYRLDWSHPLVSPLDHLFKTERTMVPRPSYRPGRHRARSR